MFPHTQIERERGRERELVRESELVREGERATAVVCCVVYRAGIKIKSPHDKRSYLLKTSN